jgi:hypothetical protein
MAQVHLLLPSFNAGELSPLLGSRFNVEKVAAGCRQLRNFIIHTHGPAFRRPGCEYMGEGASQTSRSNLRGFNFSTTTGFVLEFSDRQMKVWSNGFLVPLINPVILPYSEAEIEEVQMAQVNDVSYLAHANHPPYRLVRWKDDDWRIEVCPWTFPPLGDENVRSDEAASASSTLQLEIPTYKWPEFQIPAGDYTFDIVNPTVGTSTQKVAKLQRWNGAWETVRTLEWQNDTPPAETGSPTNIHFYRITYTGDEQPDPPTATMSARVTWTGDGGGSFLLPLNTPLPYDIVSRGIAAGDWQTTVTCSDPLPADAELWLQWFDVPTNQWVDHKKLKLVKGQNVIERGSKLSSTTNMRFQWRGPRAMMGGTARIETLSFPKSDEITLTLSAGGPVGAEATMTASAPLFEAGHVGSYWQLTHRRPKSSVDILTAPAGDETFPAMASDEIRVVGTWDVFSYGSWQSTFYLERKVGTGWAIKRSWTSNFDRNVTANGVETEEAIYRLRIDAGKGKAASGVSAPRFMLELADASINGLVQILSIGPLDTGDPPKATTATVKILVPVYTEGASPPAPTAQWTEGAWSDVRGYPRTVAFHGERLWFGGTAKEPMRLWGSVVNDFQNFKRSTYDDAGVSFTPAAAQSNALQWMASHGRSLTLGTTGDEWTVSGGTDEGPITPTSVNIQRRSNYGSKYLQARLLGDVLVFIQRGGIKVRQVAPRQEGLVWSAADLTVLAEHATMRGIRQFAVMAFPFSILWAVTNGGQLLGMTFEQEQNVFGWHVHETDGFVESVTVVYGLLADEVWVSVLRNGQRNIERLDPLVFARRFDVSRQLIYLDSATRFVFEEPTDTLTGLDYLEGRELEVVADGAQLANVRVTGGSVKIENPASVVVVGLPYTSTLQPMRVEIPMRDGTSQARQWRTARIGLTLHESISGEVADGPEAPFGKLPARRVSTGMDAPPPLINGLVEIPIESKAREGLDVVVRQRAPFPLNVISIIAKGDVYGE